MTAYYGTWVSFRPYVRPSVCGTSSTVQQTQINDELGLLGKRTFRPSVCPNWCWISIIFIRFSNPNMFMWYFFSLEALNSYRNSWYNYAHWCEWMSHYIARIFRECTDINLSLYSPTTNGPSVVYIIGRLALVVCFASGWPNHQYDIQFNYFTIW